MVGYDISHVKVSKKTALALAHFEAFFRLVPDRAHSEHSWAVTRQDTEAKNYDLKAVNPNARAQEHTCTPEELLDLTCLITVAAQHAAAVSPCCAPHFLGPFTAETDHEPAGNRPDVPRWHVLA
jgi:hypothetical protein